jgi:hypothetical protein
MNSIYQIPAGAHVSGYYYGQKFTGTVKVARLHTCASDMMCFHIALDAPLSLYGEERTGIFTEVRPNDNPTYQSVIAA